jgi:hypothetical protein
MKKRPILLRLLPARASKTMAKYYISRTDLKIVDGKLTGTETILTKPSAEEAAHEGARRFRALGAENIHVVKHTAKRFRRLMREQNKRRKENPLTVADIAQMTEQARRMEDGK